jgi:hypothetical protein
MSGEGEFIKRLLADAGSLAEMNNDEFVAALQKVQEALGQRALDAVGLPLVSNSPLALYSFGSECAAMISQAIKISEPRDGPQPSIAARKAKVAAANAQRALDAMRAFEDLFPDGSPLLHAMPGNWSLKATMAALQDAVQELNEFDPSNHRTVNIARTTESFVGAVLWRVFEAHFGATAVKTGGPGKEARWPFVKFAMFIMAEAGAPIRPQTASRYMNVRHWDI